MKLLIVLLVGIILYFLVSLIYKRFWHKGLNISVEFENDNRAKVSLSRSRKVRDNDYDKSRNYWKWLKNKLKEEGSELVSNTNQLKMKSPKDGKKQSV